MTLLTSLPVVIGTDMRLEAVPFSTNIARVFVYMCLWSTWFCLPVLASYPATCVKMHVRECDGKAARLYDGFMFWTSCCRKCAS